MVDLQRSDGKEESVRRARARESARSRDGGLTLKGHISYRMAFKPNRVLLYVCTYIIATYTRKNS